MSAVSRLQDLQQTVEQICDDSQKRVLWLIGNLALAKQAFAFERTYKAKTTVLATSPAIESAARVAAKGAVIVALADFETAPVAAYDLCVVCPAAQQLPDLYEAWLTVIARSLKPGGMAILPIPRDSRTETLAQLAPPDAVAPLQAFLKFQFADAQFETGIAERVATSPNWTVEGILAGKKAEPLLWLSLKRAQSRPISVFARSPRADRFPLMEFKGLVHTLRKGGVSVLRTGEFAERFAAYVADPERAEGSGFGILKFDIHRAMPRAHEMARTLSKASLPGLFLMMHRHASNAAYYDHDATWRILRAIQDMGHEIGLHIDPFDLVREHGDLLAGAEAATAEFSAKGLTIASATLHGDTRSTLRARGLRALDFFQEGTHVTTWDGAAPAGDENLMPHFRRYTLGDLKARTGIRFLVETTFGSDGRMMEPIMPLYVSDNTRTIATSGKRRERIKGDEPFRISPKTARRIANLMRQRPFLALFHPQWYW